MRLIADRYRLTRPIGRGGMGAVWEGCDLRLNRPIAVKLIYKSALAPVNEAVRRFNREARITARLRHPGVPVVYDFGGDGDDLYMIMEYVEGQTVADVIVEHSPLPVAWAALIGAQVCAVLSAAHRAGLIHRDIKPPNLVLTPNATVKVIDFGVAGALGGGEYSRITETGQAPGSAHYMAPELIDGEPAGRLSDLYGVGCLLHELLTGSRPFASEDLLAEIEGHRYGEPPPLGRTDVPDELATLTRALLAKTPTDRPGSAEEVFADLLPLSRGLPPLLGLTDGDLPADPVHMYAAAIAAVGMCRDAEHAASGGSRQRPDG
ncbi:serine/threonine-protein kinase [Thermopolyspora sp. NPDC052614]|uniref:serine/threonine-protein kinase n=1 Tax=Thermopolyspora sp. NPDC052614 TaxID=3155682 RepID=UPI003426843E